MPRLSKGGKWVFGWLIVGPKKNLLFPTTACNDSGFHQDDPGVFTFGGRRSGGFGIGRNKKVASSFIRACINQEGVIGKDLLFFLPSTVDINPVEQLPVARVSHLVLGSLLRGSIIGKAWLHPEIEVYQL